MKSKKQLEKEIKSLKNEIQRLNTKNFKHTPFLTRFVIVILLLWWFTILVYVIIAIYKNIRIIFMSRERQLKLEKYHDENTFNEIIYLFNDF